MENTSDGRVQFAFRLGKNKNIVHDLLGAGFVLDDFVRFFTENIVGRFEPHRAAAVTEFPEREEKSCQRAAVAVKWDLMIALKGIEFSEVSHAGRNVIDDV